MSLAAFVTATATEACLLHADVYQVEVEIGSLVNGACLTDRASVFDSVVCPNGSDRASLAELNVSCSMRNIPCLPVSAAVTPDWLPVCSWLCGRVGKGQLHDFSEHSLSEPQGHWRGGESTGPCQPAARPACLPLCQACNLSHSWLLVRKRPERLFPQC